MASSIPDHFALFGLEPRFALDAGLLDIAYKRVQDKVHPDRFAGGTPAERRIAVQWAARANEALQTLRSPVRRAAYLCELNGVALGAESNTVMPPAFLMQQLEWREALAEAAKAADPHALDVLARQTDSARAGLVDDLTRAIDADRDFVRASALVRQLMFVDKMRDEIERVRHAQVEAPSDMG
ncbi:MAG: Fe-S protein assembly co-chaperone HscB [Gemmatimonadota bacterium]